MNVSCKKTILKAVSILQFMYLILTYLGVIAGLCLYFFVLMPYKEYLPTEITEIYLVFLPIYAIVYTLWFLILYFYFGKKVKQNKEQFLQNKVVLRVIAIVDFMFDLILPILLLFAAFKKDDGLDEFVKEKKIKQKKIKTKHSKEYKTELKKLKKECRHGLISKEKFEKEKAKLIKQEKNSQQ